MHELVRLRHRFVLILMCSVGLVLTIALVISVGSNFSTQYSRIQSSLVAAQGIEENGEFRPHIGGTEPEGLAGSGMDQGLSLEKPEGKFRDMVPVYIVDIQKDTGEVTLYSNSANMDEDTLYAALARIETEGDSSGLFLDLGLFFLLQEHQPGMARVTFADASQLYSNTLTTGLIALVVWLIAMVAFFVLSLALSRMVLHPVEVAWTKQREFIADASHELKTPLTIILANNNIIMKHPEKSTEAQMQWLESTQEEATRMDGLVTDLLLLAQIENTHTVTETGSASSDDVVNDASSETESAADSDSSSAELDLSALLERSLLQFDAVFFERGLSPESTIEEGVFIRGNHEHMRRLADILLDNASKYGERGGTISVTLTKAPETSGSQKQALLTVRNSGALIPPEKLDRVFDRFYRGDAAHSNTIEGSGLGLALAQEIVREHGGTISVSSKATDDKLAQTTFTISLPLL